MKGLPMSEKEEFTKRVLMSLVVDVSKLVETAERLKVQVSTLAKEHGIKMPKAKDEAS
jgi:predicted ATP-grasp superfamily ATP-dependent carboligase